MRRRIAAGKWKNGTRKKTNPFIEPELR